MSGDNGEDLAGKSRAELLELCKERGLKASGWKKERMLQELAGEPAGEPTEKPDPDVVKKAIEEKQAKTVEAPAPATGKEASLHERMKSRTGYCAAIGCSCESWIPNGMDANRFWPMCDCQHTQWVHAPDGASRPVVADPGGDPEKKDSDDLGGDVAMVEGEGGNEEGGDHEDHTEEKVGVEHSD